MLGIGGALGQKEFETAGTGAVGFFFGSYAETQYGATHASGDDVAKGEGS